MSCVSAKVKGEKTQIQKIPLLINKTKGTEFLIDRKLYLPLGHGFLTGFSYQIFLDILSKKCKRTQVSNGMILLLTSNLTLFFFLQTST